jgi:peptidoglycan/LPS O-acetylase OafA/YrhL
VAGVNKIGLSHYRPLFRVIAGRVLHVGRTNDESDARVVTTNSRLRDALRQDSANLDLLRALAVLIVLGGHLWYSLGPQILEVWALAHLGVIAFFVHTTLVLMMSLERLHSDGRALVTLRFYLRRFFRVYPLAIVTVVVVVAAAIPAVPWVPYSDHSWIRVLANIALIQNLKVDAVSVLAVLWSLPYEVQMYGLLPFVYLAVKTYALKGAMLLSVAGVGLASIPEIRLVTQYFPCFLSGVLAYAISRKYRPVLNAWVWPATLLVLAIVFSGIVIPPPGSADWLAALVLGGVVPFVREWTGSGVVRRCAHEVAKYSYGIYVSHTPIIWLSFFLMAEIAWPAQWMTFLTLSVAVPVLLFHSLEQPFISLGARLADRIAVLWGEGRADRVRDPRQTIGIVR